MNIPTELKNLEGEPLTDVCFVTDYVQLGFSGALLACIAHPTVTDSFREITFPTLGSRDVLCSFIGHAVISVVFEEDVSIRLQFDCGIISVPLGVASQRFGESALFTPGPNKPVIVF
jgi:YD repeat-containing protein